MSNLTNYHSHCLLCDGKAGMDAFLRFAVAKGFTSYGVSSHAPLPYHTHWSMDWENMADYLAEFNTVKQKYADRIEFYLGLEIDYLNEEYNPSSKHFQELPLDYRIGSVHLLEDLSGDIVDIDVSTPVFKDIVQRHFNGDLELLVRAYFERQMRMIELGGFDILGHADKLHYNAECCRPGIMDEPWYQQLVNELFQSAAQHQLMVEINTKSYEAYHVFFPNERHFKLLHSLSIPVLVNSDSHYPERINASRMEALAALTKAGFTTVRQLHGGVWQDVTID